MTDVITGENRIQFPTKPRRVEYMEVPSAPNVAGRWLNYTYNAVPHDILWMSTCVRCDRTLWTLLVQGDMSLLDNYIPEYNIADSVTDTENEVTYRACRRCANRYGAETIRKGREIRDVDGNTAADWAVIVWPTDCFAEQLAKEAAEKAKFKQWTDPVPMEPLVGALVYLPEEHKVGEFTGWDEQGRATVKGFDPQEQEKVMTLVPAIYGIPHDNLVTLPKSALEGIKRNGNELTQNLDNDVTHEVKVVRWAFGGHYSMVVCNNNGRNVTYSADGVACFVPSVNPAVEKPKEAMARLQYALERHKYAMHQRLVAEGKSRQWCPTFDPILVSQGMDPRTGQIVITGTATFTHKINEGDWNTDVLDTVAKGKSILQYVPKDAFTFSDVEVHRPEFSRLLS